MRILLGIAAFVSAFFLARPRGWQVAVGLVVMPAAFVAWQEIRARRSPEPARQPEFGVPVSILLGVALLGPEPTRPAALLFGGVSLLVAGVRGFAGCEVTAIGNWLHGRDDQIGCVVLSPVDLAEQRLQVGSVEGGVA